MQATLSFQFPPTRQSLEKEVQICVNIPFPEQRPQTVANFMYMCTGELPSTDILQMFAQLHTSPPSSSGSSPFPQGSHYATAEAARADGLRPFSMTAVMHIDLSGLGVMEIGSSTTKSIWGGFIPDEPIQLPPVGQTASRSATALVDRMGQLRRGTVLCGNAGMPNTQGSRYYIILQDITNPAQAEELRPFAPLGIVTGPPQALDQLLAAVREVPVQPRTLTPLKKIELASCSIEMDYRALLIDRNLASAPHNKAATSTRAGVPVGGGAPLTRVAGRTRGRDEDEEEEQGGHEANEGTQPFGFFQFSARFPTTASHRNNAASGAALKRRRLEVGSIDAGEINTAVPPAEGEAFDFFRVQEQAFGNDIADIKDRQKESLKRKMRRLGKQKEFQKAHGTKAAKTMNAMVLGKIKGQQSSSNGTGMRSSIKRLNKKY